MIKRSFKGKKYQIDYIPNERPGNTIQLPKFIIRLNSKKKPNANRSMPLQAKVNGLLKMPSINEPKRISVVQSNKKPLRVINDLSFLSTQILFFKKEENSHQRRSTQKIMSNKEKDRVLQPKRRNESRNQPDSFKSVSLYELIQHKRNTLQESYQQCIYNSYRRIHGLQLEEKKLKCSLQKQLMKAEYK